MKSLTVKSPYPTLAVFSLLIFTLVGCGTTHTIRQPIANANTDSDKYFVETCTSKDENTTKEFCERLTSQVRYALLREKILGDNNGNKKIDLNISNYRKVSNGARGGLAIAGGLVGSALAGSDILEISVYITDVRSENNITDFTVSTKNIFGMDESNMHRLIANEIVEVITGKGN